MGLQKDMRRVEQRRELPVGRVPASLGRRPGSDDALNLPLGKGQVALQPGLGQPKWAKQCDVFGHLPRVRFRRGLLEPLQDLGLQLLLGLDDAVVIRRCPCSDRVNIVELPDISCGVAEILLLEGSDDPLGAVFEVHNVLHERQGMLDIHLRSVQAADGARHALRQDPGFLNLLCEHRRFSGNDIKVPGFELLLKERGDAGPSLVS
mmetsp:Transcript_25516/g.74404  ORF Transcript_25516/g.74404 Transcript_25516/m.74404 type:complete len:206 (-) Transcript_25516:225-842(-)